MTEHDEKVYALVDQMLLEEGEWYGAPVLGSDGTWEVPLYIGTFRDRTRVGQKTGFASQDDAFFWAVGEAMKSWEDITTP